MRFQSPADTLRSAATGLSAHLVYQVSARLFSFIIKAIVVRALKPAQYAFVEIRVVLLVSLALLPATTGFRSVSLRLDSENRALALASFNAIFTTFSGLTLGLVAIYIDPANTLALTLVIISIFIRAFAEIPVIFARRYQLYSQSSRARAVSIIMSGVAQTVAISLITKQSHAAPASTTGHIAYVVTLGLSMHFTLKSAGHTQPSLSLHHLAEHLYRDDLVMAAVATGEGFIKFLLENGEAIILDTCCAADVKGAYKIAANLGSVFARFFSEALEEQAFNVFSRLSPAFRPNLSVDDANSPTYENRQDTTVVSKQILASSKSGSNIPDLHAMRAACEDMLVLGLKAAISVSLLFATVGPPFAFAVVRLLYGETWANHTPAPTILSFYLSYLVFMAANGVSEAFVTASASTEELKARTKFATVLSLAYLMSLYYAAKTYGALGIILVNCFNMALRTSYSAWFFHSVTRRPLHILSGALPNPIVFIILLACRLLSNLSESHFLGPHNNRLMFSTRIEMLSRIASHAFSGIIAVSMFVASMSILERKSFRKPLRTLHTHND